MDASEKLKSEFDQAALALAAKRSTRHDGQGKRDFLKRYLPAHCDRTLEIGCGIGDYVRFLAQRSNHALGLDLSPEMIRIARERAADAPNAEFQVADVMQYDFPADHFDLVVSFTTLHHMPLEPILEQIKSTLKPGGVFINFDMCEQSGAVDRAFAFYYRVVFALKRRLLRLAGKRLPHGGGKAMRHDENEVHPMFAEVKPICQRAMPGALVREHHGLNRYSIVWKKPSPQQNRN